MELLLELVLELLFEGFAEIALEAGLAAAQENLGRHNRNPVLATIGYFVFGLALGGLSLLVLRAGFLAGGAAPSGVSLLVSPLVMGLVMHIWGGLRRAYGHRTTNLATFHGGAAFALGVALVRFLAAR